MKRAVIFELQIQLVFLVLVLIIMIFHFVALLVLLLDVAKYLDKTIDGLAFDCNRILSILGDRLLKTLVELYSEKMCILNPKVSLPK